MVRSQSDYPGYFRGSAMETRGAVDADSKSVMEPTAQDAAPGSPIHKPIMSLLPHSRWKWTSSAQTHKVMIGVGTNMGDRFANIELALRMLEVPAQFLPTRPDPHLSIVDTSFMYETAPMYVTDQPMFINCACVVRHLFALYLQTTERLPSCEGRN